MRLILRGSVRPGYRGLVRSASCQCGQASSVGAVVLTLVGAVRLSLVGAIGLPRVGAMRLPRLGARLARIPGRIGRATQETNEPAECEVEAFGQTPGGLQLRGGHIPLQLCTPHRILHLVERSARECQECCELGVCPAAESFGDVPANRVDRIIHLTASLRVCCELRPARELEDVNSQLVGELPNCKIRVTARRRHARSDCTRRALPETFDNENRSPCDVAGIAAPRSAYVARTAHQHARHHRNDDRGTTAPT